MSESTAAISRGLIEYLAARTAGDDAFLRELKAAAHAAGIPSIWIPPEEGSLLQVLLRVARATEVVEVGTLAGYSAIWMARALPAGGRVRTIELSPKHAAFARAWIARSDVSERVEVLEGRGGDVLRTMAASSVDAVFLDADKSGYADYVEQAARILRPSGLLLVDNAFAFGQVLDAEPEDREAPAIQAFNEQLARDTRFQSLIVPIGDGLWVGARRA
ncbi:MAG: O-methyltransferase [Planctomycetota bacterium]|nr:O-methyltransferase [Planctomycetota bacterium]